MEWHRWHLYQQQQQQTLEKTALSRHDRINAIGNFILTSRFVYMFFPSGSSFSLFSLVGLRFLVSFVIVGSFLYSLFVLFPPNPLTHASSMYTITNNRTTFFSSNVKISLSKRNANSSICPHNEFIIDKREYKITHHKIKWTNFYGFFSQSFGLAVDILLIGGGSTKTLIFFRFGSYFFFFSTRQKWNFQSVLFLHFSLILFLCNHIK